MLHVMNADQKIKKYLKIAGVLTIVTVVELAVVVLTFLPPAVITTLVVVLSLAKAYLVAWYFMHLNHERSWTRIVALLPLGMVVYAGVLLADQKFRPISHYVGEPARIFTPPADHQAADKENAVVEAPVALETVDEGAEEATPVEASPTETPAEAPATSDGGGDEWR